MKRIFYLITVVALGSLLWACQKDKADPKPDPKPDPTANDGSAAKPYTVAEAKEHQDSSTFWVHGYVIGNYQGDSTPKDRYSAPFYNDFNLLIADNASDVSTANAICVQLIGTQRNDGLKTKATNKGLEVWCKGQGIKYNSMAGLKNTTEVRFAAPDTGGGTVNPGTDPDPVTSLSETFESFVAGTGAAYMSTQTNNKGWKGVKVGSTTTLEPDVRNFNNNNYVQFSAHRSTITTQIAQEFWLVSPRLDISSATNKTFSFDLAAGYYNASTTFDVYLLDSDNPATANKTKLTFTAPASIPASGYTTFASSGSIDLSGYSGVKRIGFCYKGTSGSGNSTTYQIDNFVFGGATIQTLTVTPASLSFVQGGEAKTITVTSNTTWTATSSDQTNFAVSTSGNTVTVTAAANSTGASRSATITVKTTDNAITKTVSCSQAGPAASGTEVALFDFTTGATTTSIAATTGSGTLTRPLGASNTSMSYTASSKSIYASFGTSEAGAHWLFTMPTVAQSVRTISLTYKAFGTAKSPKSWKFEISTDKTTWTAGSTYDLPSTAVDIANAVEKTVTATFATATTAGTTVYARLIPDMTTTSIDGSPIGAGGASAVNNRLATSVSVKVE